MAILPLPNFGARRLQRSAARPELETTQAVARVHRFDGHTRVLAIRTEDGWRRSRHLRWTPQTIETLRGNAREVLLSRRFRRARVSIAWFPATQR